MGKATRIVLIAIAAGVILFNLLTLDYGQLWSDESQIRWIGVVSGLCAILIIAVNQRAQRIHSEFKRLRTTGSPVTPPDSPSHRAAEPTAEDQKAP